MKQNRKYFGMTQTQIAILAALAGVACLLFGLAGFFVLRRGVGGLLSRAPAITPTIQPTSTLIVIPSVTPTETPTPVPYAMLIPDGWVQFKTGLIELWLPKMFKVGDSKLIKNSPNLAKPELIATGTTSKSSLYKMVVLIAYEPLNADSLDTYLDSKIAQLSTDIRLTERRKVSVNSVDAVRLMLETQSNNTDVNALVYVFLDGSTAWYVEYVAQINEFYAILPTFEQSVKTFRVVQ